MSIQNSQTFKLLKKQHKKSVKCQHRISNIQAYLQCDTIPKGFKINAKPNIGSVSKKFMTRWENILKRCSKELMSLCLSWDHHKLGQYENNITALNLSLTQTNSDADLREANNIIRTYNEALTKNLQNTQEKKFVRDNVSLKSNSRTNNITNVSRKKTKAPRSRRFVRKAFPTTDGENSNAKVCPVLNVSSISYRI